MPIALSLARALAPVAMVAGAAASAAAPSPDLGKVTAHLAAMQSLTANFVQTDGRNRSAAGTLQLKRPGRVRFQYGSGDLLLVGSAGKLNFIDYQVGQKSSWKLDDTPLGVLLSANPDIKRIAHVVPNKDARVLVVQARDFRHPQYGTLTLAFLREPAAPGGLMLYGWTAVDAQNKRTTVRLTNQRYNVAVPESAFTFTEPQKKKR